MKKIVIATNNLNKIREYRQMMEPLGYEIVGLKDLNITDDIEENGTTFKENAIIKAKYISDKYHITCISDDSGLEITALNNEPGIYSARYMGKDTSYDIKNQNLIDRVKDQKDRSCRFVCAIAYCEYGQEPKVFEGIVEGEVAYKIEGSNGFGYDPIFYYPEFKTTLANVDNEKKNKISHRYNALVKLLGYLSNE